ncbi:8124_t:CDS:2, partial [Cetraspora pellucida]
MKESNCHILLILDKASTHVIGSLSFSNMEVLFLSFKTTSKIQPMNAGIIASFKLYYHRLQLQHAIDLDEADEKAIYKVSSETIKHCWAHTKIVTPRNEAGLPISVHSITNANDSEIVEKNLAEEQELVEELQHQIDALHIRIPMSFTDENFVQGAMKIEQEEEEEMVDDSGTTLKSLHKIQTHIREEVRREQNEKQ